MIARLVVLACTVLCGNAAIAATEYGVDELGVGAQPKLDSASYREFSCNPSEQFEVLTWCQKTRHDSVLPNQQPRAIQLTGDPATSPEAQKRAGDHDTEDDRVGEPTDAHAVISPSGAEPAEADARSSRWEKSNWWESFAYGSIAGLLLRLAALAIVMLRNRMRETARKHRPLDAWPRLIEASPEPRVGDGEATPRALSPEAALVRIEAIRRSLVAEATSPARPLLDRQMVAVGA